MLPARALRVGRLSVGLRRAYTRPTSAPGDLHAARRSQSRASGPRVGRSMRRGVPDSRARPGASRASFMRSEPAGERSPSGSTTPAFPFALRRGADRVRVPRGARARVRRRSNTATRRSSTRAFRSRRRRAAARSAGRRSSSSTRRSSTTSPSTAGPTTSTSSIARSSTSSTRAPTRRRCSSGS